MRQRIFIGSSDEGSAYAKSIQTYLEKNRDLEIVCWTNLFNHNNYTLEELLNILKTMSFGIFVLAPDDFVQLRSKKNKCARDNVILELGMSYGALGRERSFFIVPETDKNGVEFRLPSDLEELKSCVFYIPNNDRYPDKAVTVACISIERSIELQTEKIPTKDTIEEFGVFPEFDHRYPELFASSNNITTFFIHSYRWRETQKTSINEFFKRKDVHWDVILPDITNKNLLTNLKNHFSDGRHMVSKVIEVYECFNELAKKYPKKLTIRLFDLYPVYTFYKFDNMMVISLYPLTPERRPTPTFLIDTSKQNSDFFVQDVNNILYLSRPKSTTEMDEIINQKRR